MSGEWDYGSGMGGRYFWWGQHTFFAQFEYFFQHVYILFFLIKKKFQINDQVCFFLFQDSAQEGVITRDIHRTFPAHDYFKDTGGDGQESLYKICKVGPSISFFSNLFYRAISQEPIVKTFRFFFLSSFLNCTAPYCCQTAKAPCQELSGVRKNSGARCLEEGTKIY